MSSISHDNRIGSCGVAKPLLIVISIAALSACGGGGSASSVGNRAPVANAGADQNVNEFDVVQLNGSGSDADGDNLSYSWTQTAGQSVTINNANMAQASFTAPDVAPGAPENLTFQLSVSDGNGGNTSDTVTITVADPNNLPSADAGVDQNVNEFDVVQLNGSGSDPDAGSTLGFVWTQTGGQGVTINNANMAQADFTAPDVTLGTPEVLTFQLEVSDGIGGVDTDSVAITVQEPQIVVTISGKVQYEFVPPIANCNGLNFNGTVNRPIRQATVEIWEDRTGADVLIDSMVSNDAGDYQFTVNANTDVFIRVRAELIRPGPNPSWDVEVRDNTSSTGSPLSQRPLYVLDDLFNSGTLNMNRDVIAATGWDGASYTDVRAAAPFAILDTIYTVMSVILAEDPQADFPALDAFWSVNNSSSPGTGNFDDDVASGEIGGPFYGGDRLFLLGMANDNTDEFDDHVVVHEWGHYFDDNFSRSDSIGGPHSLGQSLDMRLAFGEGFATALSGIALNNRLYCDTFGAGQNNGFDIDIESDAFGVDGWYNEVSVLNLIYDLWDTAIDGADNDSLGFGPIYNVMTGTQVVTPAFTSIFSFATELKAQNPGRAAFIDGLLAEHNIITAGIDIYGSGESNSRGGALDVLPIYTNVPIGAPFQICSNSQFDNGRDGNKLSEHRYLILDVNPASALTFTIDTVNPPSQPSVGFDCTADPDDPENHEHSDPDIVIFQNGNFVGGGFSCQPNSEVTTSTPLSGRYVLDVVEFRYLDEDSPPSPPDPMAYPEQICFDITIAP